MKSTYATKEKWWLVQVECKWCSELNKNNLKHKFYMAYNFWEEAPFPSLLYIITLYGAYIQIAFFLGTPKIGTHIVLKLLMTISSSNQAYLEHEKAISYNLQKYLSNDALHALNKDHLILALKGFVSVIKFPIDMHIKSKWTMQGHFKHLYFKTFLLVSWRPNFVSKMLDSKQTCIGTLK